MDTKSFQFEETSGYANSSLGSSRSNDEPCPFESRQLQDIVFKPHTEVLDYQAIDSSRFPVRKPSVPISPTLETSNPEITSAATINPLDDCHLRTS